MAAAVIDRGFPGARFDKIEAGARILDLPRFLDANRYPLRLKTL